MFLKCFPLLTTLPALLAAGLLLRDVQAQETLTGHLDPPQLRVLIDRMKESPRGPFVRIRWFCADGKTLPPGEGACSEHGGGVQHGEWSSFTRAIRDQGYQIATLLIDLNTLAFVGAWPQLDKLRQILMEQFLIQNDDGWVFRQARYYRGALQVEDERASARVLVMGLVLDPDWRQPERYLLMREAARLLPVAQEQQISTRVRELATEIADADPGFQNLRIKLHGLPDATDAQRVRDYMNAQGKAELMDQYRSLGAALESLYAPRTGVKLLEGLVAESRSRRLRAELGQLITQLKAAPGLQERLQVAADAAVGLREQLLAPTVQFAGPDQLRLLQASLALEQEIYALGNQLLEQQPQADRRTRLLWLRSLGKSLLASGLVSGREWNSLDQRIADLLDAKLPGAGEYFDALRYLERVPQWAQRAMEFQFGPTVTQWLDLTPLATHLVPDRLRGSPLLSYTRTLDVLMQDANRLVGVRQFLFDRPVAGGLRALNPGLRRGVLLAAPADGEAYRKDGIYLLPSTTPELPPIAGILTRGEGSSLSHVQLLARNLAIPNVVVDDALLGDLQAHLGERIVLAVSARGTVQIMADGPRWDTLFGREELDTDVVIRPDLDKLDLKQRALLSLDRIRAADSGRIVGPKAANLGELRSYYPESVNPGLVITFGEFRALLERTLEPGGPTVFDWMRTEYARLGAITDPALRQEQAQAFLARLRSWITGADPGAAFRERLASAMQTTFGGTDGIGVFVRSDTNVEDLPGFTGAGLNLTLPNVVGFDAILSAIQQVWASPFTERAYAWRQAHMQQPEHVYPAVLLLKTFASEKSGVLVTTDVETGDRRWLSIATSEGVGGAVEGQAAEELRVDRITGKVRLLSQATAPLRAEPLAAGGMHKVAASGREELLLPGEIQQLRRLVDDVERRFPLQRGDDRQPVPMDIEFGFGDGKLALFQIRPFVESQRARRSQYLVDMDRDGDSAAAVLVDLSQVPDQGTAP